MSLSLSEILSAVTFWSDPQTWTPAYPADTSPLSPEHEADILNAISDLYNGSSTAKQVLSDYVEYYGVIRISQTSNSRKIGWTNSGGLAPQVMFNFDPDYYITMNGDVATSRVAITFIHELIHGVSAIATGTPVGDPNPNATDADFNNPAFDMRGSIVTVQNNVAVEMAASNPDDWTFLGSDYRQGSYYVQLDQDELDDQPWTLGHKFTEGEPIDQVRLATYAGSEMHMEGRGESRDLLIGSWGVDLLYGGAGNDYLYGYGDADTLVGGDGDDHLYGGAQSDTILGGSGNDIIWGGDKDDETSSQTETDKADYSATQGSIKVTYSVGTQTSVTVSKSDGVDTLHSIEKIIGTPGRDTLSVAGSIASDSILTFDADHGQLGAADLLNGAGMTLGSGFTVTIAADGTGNVTDNATGGTIQLLNFDTSIIGTEGSDHITDMTDGAKLIDAGNGDNVISVGGSSSRVKAGFGSDTIDGSDGDDVLLGGGGEDTINGGDGNDFLSSTGLMSSGISPTLDGEAGNDWLSGINTTGATLSGGAGDDVVDLSTNPFGAVVEFGAGDGHDTILRGNDECMVDLNSLSAADCTLIWDTEPSNPFTLDPGDTPWIYSLSGSAALEIKSTGDTIYLGTLTGNVLGWLSETPNYQVFMNSISFNGANFIFADGTVDGSNSPEMPALSVQFGDVSALNVAEVEYASSLASDVGSTSGTPGDDNLWGGSAGGAVSAGDGNDTVYAARGAYSIDGGAGEDTYDVFGDADTYIFTNVGGDLKVTDRSGLEGSATLHDVEHIHFDKSDITAAVSDLLNTSDNAPLVVGGSLVDAFSELSDVSGCSTPDIATGDILFTDADAGDSHAVTVVDVVGSGATSGLPSSTVLQSFLALGAASEPEGTSPGSISWTFSAPDSTFDYLAAGATVTLGYTIQINDQNGGAANQDVTITVTGAEDAPVLIATGAQTVAANASTALIGLGLNDPDVGDVETVTLTSGTGLLDAAPTEGLSIIGSGTNALTLSGTVDAVAGALNAVSYTAGDEGTDTIAATASDGTLSDGRSFSVTISAAGSGGGAPTIVGTPGDETLYGTGGADVIDGLGGDDTLLGGDGSDTYLYASGDGNDTIFDENFTGGFDVLKLTDLDPSNVTLRRDGTHLYVRDDTTGQVVTILYQWHAPYDQGIEQIQFANGTTWDREQIREAAWIRGDGGDNALSGSSDGDTLVGGTGNDSLQGGDGSDTYIYASGDGNDTIFDENFTPGGVDVLKLTDLDPTNVSLRRDGAYLFVRDNTTGEEITVLYQWHAPYDQGIEQIQFADGTTWDREQIREAAWFRGDDGANSLSGSSDGDTLVGGKGDDSLQGGDGSDTYVYASGDGNDTIFDENFTAGGTDVLKLTDLNAADLTLRRDGPHLFVKDNTTGQEITILYQWHAPYDQGIEQIQFADGTSWDREQIRQAAWFRGDDNDNTIDGSGQDDTLEGGKGNDYLQGGDGSDTYVYSSGDGDDTIFDENFTGGTDVLKLTDLNPSDVSLHGDGTNVVVHDQTTGSDITLSYEFHAPYDQGIDQIEFANGTIWDRDRISEESATLFVMFENAGGGGGSNFIYGSADNEKFTSTSGDYTIAESAGDDTYVWELGNGNYVIRGSGSWDGVNTVKFGAGIAPADLHFAAANNGNGVLITVDGQAGSVLIEDELADGSDSGIDRLKFSDGTVWSRSQLLAAAYAQMGTPGDDTIWLANVDSVVDAGAGDDVINARGGNDTITGGPGDDLIYESAGNDTYVWNLGDGSDIIRGSGWWDGVNTLQLGAGIDPADTLITYEGINGVDIRVSVAGQPGFVELEGQRDNSEGVDEIRFADGTVWDKTEMAARAITPPIFEAFGTAANDSLSGGSFAEDISGKGGDDDLRGGGGNDILRGGVGNDNLIGGSGDDTYVFNLGDGVDTISEWNGEGYDDPGFDTLQFGPGIDPADVEVTRDGDRVSFSIIGTSDKVSIYNQFNGDPRAHVEQVVFADGTVWSDADVLARAVIRGTSGDETLWGTSDADTFSSGAGNDGMIGGAGDDTYLFNLGDGQDSVSDWNGGGYDNPGVDTVKFGAGIAPADIVVTRSGDNVILAIAGTSDQVLIYNQFNGDTRAHIEQVAFADGTVWTDADVLARAVIRGTPADETLWGSSDPDTFSSGPGNDGMIGGAGDDTYLFDRGDGQDSVSDWNGGGYSNPGLDTVKFGAGIAPTDLLVTRSGDSVVLAIAGTSDQLLIYNQFNGDTRAHIEQIVFDDGTVWTDADLLGRTATSGNDHLTGIASADTIRGLDGNDTILGLGGNDQLSGDAGNDFLDGGAGDDALTGGDGDDTLYGDGYVATGDNLIANGSFEELGSNLDYQPWGIWSTDIPGWTTNSGRYNQVNSGNNGTLATDGAYLMDLDDAGGPGSNMDIRQTVGDLTAGEKLLLSFDHGNPLNSDSGFFQVYWNGDLVATITDTATQTQSTQILVTATAGDNELRFQGTGAEDGMGAQLDNVRLLAAQAVAGGDDTLSGGAGDDYLDGGAGDDTAVFSGDTADYSIVTNNGLVAVTDNAPTVDGDDGTDTLVGIETLQFADGTTSLAAPIVLDLYGHGVKLISSRASRTKFDWNDDGVKDASGWVGKGDGLLFIDRDGDGLPGSAKELSFLDDKPGAKSDLDGLSAFDSNGDGLLSDLDDRFGDFRVWVDRNGNGSADAHEVLTLAQVGIASINLTGDPTHDVWNWGDDVVINNGSFTRTNGRKGALADVAISYGAQSTKTIKAHMTGPHPTIGWQRAAAARLVEAMVSHGNDAGSTHFDAHGDWIGRHDPMANLAAHAA